MLKEIDNYQGIYNFETVFLDNRSRAMMQNLYDFRKNKGNEGGEVGWGCSAAPLLDDSKLITYYVGKIIERLKPSMKSLSFAEDSILPPFIASLKRDDIKNATIEDLPILFALGAVICNLDSHNASMRSLERLREHRKKLMEQRAERNTSHNLRTRTHIY